MTEHEDTGDVTVKAGAAEAQGEAPAPGGEPEAEPKAKRSHHRAEEAEPVDPSIQAAIDNANSGT